MGGIVRAPKLGDIVLYRASQGRSAGEKRPAIVVIVHSADVLSLHVFDAGIRDSGAEYQSLSYPNFVNQVPRGKERGEWSWPDE